jgi:hypothetical protein
MALRYETMKVREHVVYREVGEIGLDYAVVEDRLYSINGGFGFNPPTEDYVRWEVREVKANPKTNVDVAEKAAYDFYKAQGHPMAQVRVYDNKY